MKLDPLIFPHPHRPSARFALWQGWDADRRLCDYLGDRKAWARWPHHTASVHSLLGSVRYAIAHGVRVWKLHPGEIMLAGAGVLALDELPEFKREVIEHLARAWREGVRLSATGGGLVLDIPVSCSVYATAQPCPCGMKDRPGGPQCACTPEAMKRWQRRLDFHIAAFKGVKVVTP